MLGAKRRNRGFTGSRGQFVLSGGSNVDASHYSYDSSDANGEHLRVFAPGADFFVASNLAIGIDGDASYVYTQGYGSDGGLDSSLERPFSGSARASVSTFPRGPVLSWFPRVTVGYETRSTLEQSGAEPLSVSGDPLGYPTTTESGLFVKVSAPLLLHVIPHLFFGLGPDFYRDFGNVSGGPNVGGQTTQFGLSLVVGAYWGGAATPAAPHATFARRGACLGASARKVNSSSRELASRRALTPRRARGGDSGSFAFGAQRRSATS